MSKFLYYNRDDDCVVDNITVYNIHHHTKILWDYFPQDFGLLLHHNYKNNRTYMVEVGKYKYSLHYNTNYGTKYCGHYNCKNYHINNRNGDEYDDIPCLYSNSISQYWKQYDKKNNYTGNVVRISNHWNSIIDTNGRKIKDNFNTDTNGCGSNDWYLVEVPTTYKKDKVLSGIVNVCDDFIERGSYNYDWDEYEAIENGWNIDYSNEYILSHWMTSSYTFIDDDEDVVTYSGFEDNDESVTHFVECILLYLYRHNYIYNKIKNKKIKIRIKNDFVVTHRLLEGFEKFIILKKKYGKNNPSIKKLLRIIRKNKVLAKNLFKNKFIY